MHINHLRKLINVIDALILCLLRVRQKVVTEVTKYKERHHLPTLDPARETSHMIALVKTGGKVGLSAAQVTEIFYPIMDVSRAHQNLNRGLCASITIRDDTFCVTCNWTTAGVCGPDGATKRICPRCARPLSPQPHSQAPKFNAW